MLELPIVEPWLGEATWVMAGERTRIGLGCLRSATAAAAAASYVHYALHVLEPDFDRRIERLRATGREVYVRDHAGYGNGRGRSAYITDPDGHCLELWTWTSRCT